MNKERLIKKWLNNELTEAEKQDFLALEEAPLFEEILEESMRFKASANTRVPDVSHIQERLIDHKKRINWGAWASGIAAILVVGYGLLYVFNQSNLNTITTMASETQNITLPDDSKVILNELSELVYSASDWDEKRTLELKGEAFFDVEKGQRFDVNTSNGTVSVLGTEFNVKSYDSIFYVACYEGMVQVEVGDDIIKLPAGESFKLSKGEEQKADIFIIKPRWLNKSSVFERTAISKVFDELENQFNISIDDHSIDGNILFTGAFEHNDLEAALKAITSPLSLTYEMMESNKVKISNIEQ